MRIDDVERLDSTGKMRNFSDGIGKVSLGMVKKIWESSEKIGETQPTVFQIRYAGAKGVVRIFESRACWFTLKFGCLSDCFGPNAPW